MSVTLDFVCHECKKSHWAGQRNYLYAEPHKLLEVTAAWLIEHMGHHISFENDHSKQDWMYDIPLKDRTG